MRTLVTLLLLAPTSTHGPANAQQLPPKVFDIRNGTTATVPFNVLVGASDAATRRNAASLAKNGAGTFTCGFSTCYVAFRSAGAPLTRRVYGAKKYVFSISGGKLDLFTAPN